MKADARTRLTLVDGMRGVAALAVMLYHYAGGPLRLTLVDALPWPLVGLLGHGWLGVHVFFVLSGFVIAYAIGERRVTGRGAGLFVLRRQVRLDPPYWASIALVTAGAWYLAWKHHDGRAAPSVGDVVRQALYVQSIARLPPVQSVYWSLAIEVQFYLVFVALLGLWGATPRVRDWKWFPGLACLVTGAFSVEARVHHRVGLEWITGHWYLFAVGACTHWTLAGRFPRWLFLPALLALCEVTRESMYLEPCVGASVAAVLYAAGRCAKLATWMRGAAWQWLGRMSYTVYLVHTTAGAISRGLLGRRVSDAQPMGALVVIACAVCASLLLAWALHELVEKPAIRWARRIRWAEDAPAARDD